MRRYWVVYILATLFIPNLVFADGLVIDCARDGSCNDVSDLLIQAITIADFLLGIAGSIALVMFVVGGFQYITAFSGADQAKKAKQTLLYSVLGLIIAFSAYMIVGFIMNSLGISSYFR
jgi:hypothetical protein